MVPENRLLIIPAAFADNCVDVSPEKRRTAVTLACPEIPELIVATSNSSAPHDITALAFIFSIQDYKPALFYVLDEVDAALDKHNSEKLVKLIRKYSERAQYIVISHNDSIITEANILYGVSMGANGISNVISLKI